MGDHYLCHPRGVAPSSAIGKPRRLMTLPRGTEPPISRNLLNPGFRGLSTSLPAHKSWEVRVLNPWSQSKGLLDTIWSHQLIIHLKILRPREDQGLGQTHQHFCGRDQVTSKDLHWPSPKWVKTECFSLAFKVFHDEEPILQLHLPPVCPQSLCSIDSFQWSSQQPFGVDFFFFFLFYR